MNINDLYINTYKFEDINNKNKKQILFLHGWQSNLEVFNDLYSYLKDDYDLYSFDFPGFGLSEEPKVPYTVLDYVEILRSFILKNNLNNPILIGHSFGCRVIIKYLNIYNNIKNVILIGSAGIRPKRTLKYYFKVYSYKFLKIFKIKLKTGSKDYNNSSNIMKKTLINVVNEDLKNEIKNIKANTLLIFGDNDQETPLKYGYIMEDLIEKSNLAIIPNSGHYPFIDNLNYFKIVLNSYLASELND